MIGQTIAHYRILEPLGQGGMGVVYKAEDTRLQRVVALKFLPEALRTDSAARAQFLREARAASQLKHPNVLTIYTVEESGEGDFIAMEYAESGTLRERVGELTIAQTIDFMSQAAAGLQAAHDRGIIHRDIKPDNLLIDADGRLRVSDFGLARVSWDNSGALHSSVAVGTAHYMSPEQVTGGAIDARADIFALGATFFEMIARRRPFEGDYVMSVLYAIANDDAPRLSEFEPAVPERVDRIIARCLAKSPADRYASCRDLISDLEKFMRGGEQETAPAGPEVLISEQHHASGASHPIIGRQNELAAIATRLSSAIAGAGFTIFLAGESGVGKSRLAEAAISSGRDLGMGVLAGRCLPHGGGLPFHAYANAIRNGIPRLTEVLAGSLERRAALLGIEMRNRLPIIKSFLNMSGASTVANQEQLWDSLLTLLRIICAERPVILYLDDLQWADDDTLRFFGYVARNAVEMPVVQLATYRTSAADDGSTQGAMSMSDLVRQLHADGYADLIEVQRLSASETLQLASQLLDRPIISQDLAETITRRTDGNPLFVHEVVQLIRQTGISQPVPTIVPTRIRDIVAQRVEKLAAADRELLEMAACEPEYFDSDILAECLKFDRIPLLKMLQRLESVHRLVRHEGTRYRIDHPLVREVVYEGILPELRVEYHRMLAQSLIARNPDSAEQASRIAHHLLESGQQSASVPLVLRAAERARDLCANTEALRLYASITATVAGGESLAANDRLRYLLGYGDVLLAKGQTDAAHEKYTSALQLAQSIHDVASVIDAKTRLSAPYRMRGALDSARDSAQDAAEAARSRGDHMRLSDALTALAMTRVTRAEYAAAIESASELTALASQLGDLHRQSVSWALIGAAYLHSGQYDKSAENLARAIEMQRSIGDQKGLASSLNFSGLAHHRLASFSRSIQQHQESLRIKRAIQEISAIPGSLNALGDVYRDIGQLELALQHHGESLEMARLHSNRGAMCDNLRDLGVDFILLGQYEEAEKSLNEVLRIAAEYKYPWYETRACSTMSDLARQLHDLQGAHEYSQRGLNLARHVGAIELLAEALLARARVLASEDGYLSEAADLVSEGINLAESGSLMLPLRDLYHTYADLHRRWGDTNRAREALRTAQRLLSLAASSIEDDTMRQRFLRMPVSLAILADSPENPVG